MPQVLAGVQQRDLHTLPRDIQCQPGTPGEPTWGPGLCGSRIRRQYSLVLAVLLVLSSGGRAQAPPSVPAKAPYSPFATVEEAEAFLHSAKVIQSKPLGGGVSGALKLLLDDGKIQHAAVFKDIDVHKKEVTVVKGVPETDFKDSWKYEVAAYRLDRLLGLNMVPVTVERKINDKQGSLQLWMDGCMNEARRLKVNPVPPNPLEWNRQMYKYHLFDNLVYNSDSNLGNALVTPDFLVFKIDHTRTFKNIAALPNTGHLVSFSRSLVQALEKVDKDDIKACCKNFLSSMEIDSLLKRGNLILRLYRRLVAEKGESILYP